MVLDLVIDGKAHPVAAAGVALEHACPGDARPQGGAGRRPGADRRADGEPATTRLREAAVRAIGTWNVASLQNKLVELVGAASTSRGVRAAAIEALVQEWRGRRAPGRRER